MDPFQKRIQNLQKSIRTTETGIFDVPTANAFLKNLGIQVPETADFTERKKSLQRYLGFKVNDVDEIFCTNTARAIPSAWFGRKPKPIFWHLLRRGPWK